MIESLQNLNLSQEKINEIQNLPTIELSFKAKDLTGKKQGHLIFLKPAQKKNNRIFWWTLCDRCNKIELTRTDSKKEQCQECAHIITGQKNIGNGMLDLTNQRFEKLIALYPLDKRINKKIYWHCKCDCGNEIDVLAASLTSGNTKSCGCLKKENAYFVQYKENLVGQTFGYLTVLEETNKRQYEKVIWKCQCECGNIIYLNTGRLKSGNDISCGCKKQSLGALNITKILDDNNILYIKEYTDVSLNKMRFDFAIIDSNHKIIRLIEYDGEQHFRITGGWNNEKAFKQGRQRDQEKNEWAKENNIPLVRIPYWERDNITLDMILGDKYLVC